MRTPNTECVICGKPLYRRPSNLAKVRYVACMKHRVEASKLYPQTDDQKKALELGREKGTNHLDGIPKSDESKRRRSIKVKQTYAEHPEILQARGEKTRGDKHYRWKGGSSKLNNSIRTMTENRKWMDAIKERDKECVRCGSTECLESHHVKPLALIVEENNIRNRDCARNCKSLWNLDNGITLCKKCHYDEHGRAYRED